MTRAHCYSTIDTDNRQLAELRDITSKRERQIVLGWSVTFIIVALLAALLGFTGIAGTAAGIAKILFVIFLVLFLVSLIFGRQAKV